MQAWKKKKKLSSKALENASLEKRQRKPGKKKKRVQKRWRMQVWKNSNASLEKKNRVQKRWRMQVWKKKQSSKAQENATVGILKKSDDGKDIIKKD